MPPIRLAIALPERHVYSETFIASHLSHLQRLVLTLSDGRLPQEANGQPLIQVGGLRNRLRLGWDRRVRGMDDRAMRRARIATALSTHRVQVLLAEYGNTAVELIDSCLEAAVPLVAHFHGFDAHKHEVLAHHGNYARLFKHAAALVVVSRAMEQQLLRLGAPQQKIFYNCYGIDMARFAEGDPGNAPPHFLSVGRFVDKKAPWLTILAFHKVHQQRPDARLTMAGDGVLRGAAQGLVQALALEGCVDLCGVKTPAEVAALMRQSRAFVQHSVVPPSGDSEGTPLAVLEAMATGVPVIATRHAGIVDVVAHGERGLLCAEYDVEAMAANLLRMVDRPDEARAMGQAGRAYALEHHRVEDSMARLQGLLERVAGGLPIQAAT